MTKKHFELLADALREARKDTDTAAVETVASHIACALRRTNPRFDSERFMRATRRTQG